MQDRRAAARHRVDFNGRLILSDASSLFDCRVMDMTEDGARLELFCAMEVPDRAYLWERQTNMVFECAVRWRKPGAVGVSFEGRCGQVMRQAILEACSLGPLVSRRPPPPARKARAGRRQRVEAR